MPVMPKPAVRGSEASLSVGGNQFFKSNRQFQRQTRLIISRKALFRPWTYPSHFSDYMSRSDPMQLSFSMTVHEQFANEEPCSFCEFCRTADVTPRSLKKKRRKRSNNCTTYC